MREHTGTTPENMARLSASEVACYRWPEDTAEHRAMRAAFMDGAAHTVKAVNGHEALVKALTDLLEMCMSIGDFKNGVTHNCIDEGEVYASGIFDQARQALRDHTGTTLSGEIAG